MAFSETMSEESLEKLFEPESIALIGASSDPTKLSGRPFHFLQEYGYDGDVYLVNPNTDEIDGKRCYDAITALPESVDLAMVLVPATVTTKIVEECGRMDIPFAVLIASGYSETGEEGDRLERELLRTADEHGVRLVGPNSEGMINLPDNIPLSFSSLLKRDDLRAGSVSFVTQSGAFGGALFQLSQNLGIGTSKWVSTGNEANISTLDYLDYLVDDPDTDLIVTYVEGLSEGRRLLDIGRRAVENDTHIITMRVGASPEGQEAAASHTGSIATEDAIYENIFRQSGITRIRSVDEFVDAISAFGTLPSESFPRADGDNGLGVISMSGGAAVLIADTCDRIDLPLASLSESTRETIKGEIPPYGSETNPVDVTAAAISDPEVFNTCIGSVLDDENVTGLVVQFGNSGGDIIEEFKDDLIALNDNVEEAIATVFTGNPPIQETEDELRSNGILVFEDPVRSVETMKNLADRARFLDKGVNQLNADTVGFDDRTPIDDNSWPAIVDEFEAEGLRFAKTDVVGSADEAVAVANDIGYPVALKLNPLEVEHKSESGGVKPGLSTSAEVHDVFDDIEGASSASVVVQEMVDGIEVIVGVTDDPDFGPVMLFGPGGIFVELFDDFAYRALPVSKEEARSMIDRTNVGALLDGFRGRPPGNAEALAEAMAAISRVYCQYDVDELEINPLIVTPDDALAVDLLLE